MIRTTPVTVGIEIESGAEAAIAAGGAGAAGVLAEDSAVAAPKAKKAQRVMTEIKLRNTVMLKRMLEFEMLRPNLVCLLMLSESLTSTAFVTFAD